MGRPWLVAAMGITMLGASVPAQAGPAVATRWQKVTASQDDCLKQAEEVIRKTGFGRIERTQQSRYGSLDDYTAVIRCIAGNGLAIFIVSGPSRAQSDQMSGALFQNWK